MIIKSTRSDDIEFKFSNVGLKFLYFFIILILFLLLKVTWNYCAVSWTLEKNKCVNHMYIEAVQFVVNCIPKRIWSAIAFTRKLSNKCLFMWYRRWREQNWMPYDNLFAEPGYTCGTDDVKNKYSMLIFIYIFWLVFCVCERRCIIALEPLYIRPLSWIWRIDGTVIQM